MSAKKTTRHAVAIWLLSSLCGAYLVTSWCRQIATNKALKQLKITAADCMPKVLVSMDSGACSQCMLLNRVVLFVTSVKPVNSWVLK